MMMMVAWWRNDSKFTVRNWGGLALGLGKEGREEVSGRVGFRYLKYGQGHGGVSGRKV